MTTVLQAAQTDCHVLGADYLLFTLFAAMYAEAQATPPPQINTSEVSLLPGMRHLGSCLIWLKLCVQIDKAYAPVDLGNRYQHDIVLLYKQKELHTVH